MGIVVTIAKCIDCGIEFKKPDGSPRTRCEICTYKRLTGEDFTNKPRPTE